MVMKAFFFPFFSNCSNLVFWVFFPQVSGRWHFSYARKKQSCKVTKLQGGNGISADYHGWGRKEGGRGGECVLDLY